MHARLLLIRPVPPPLLPAGTPYTRRSFLIAAAAALQPLAALGPFSPGDCHSMLLLLCPDFPLSSVRNCWAAAVELGRRKQQQQQHQGLKGTNSSSAATQSAAGAPAKQQSHSSGTDDSCDTAAGAQEAGAAVPLAALLEALGAVMLHERWLLLLRSRCFNERKACEPGAPLHALPHSLLA